MGNQETLATLDIPDTGRRHTQKEKKKKRKNKKKKKKQKEKEKTTYIQHRKLKMINADWY